MYQKKECFILFNSHIWFIFLVLKTWRQDKNGDHLFSSYDYWPLNFYGYLMSNCVFQITNMPVCRFCVHQIYQDVYYIGKHFLVCSICWDCLKWGKWFNPLIFNWQFFVFISSLTSLLTIFYTRNQHCRFQTWAVLRKSFCVFGVV